MSQPRLTLLESIEKWLWKRGFSPGPVRRVTVALMALCLVLLPLGLLSLPFVSWPFWLAVGALLSTWNFYSLALFVQRLFPRITAEASQAFPNAEPNTPEEQKKEGTGKAPSGAASQFFLQGQIFRSYFRLFITGILVYMALVVCRANPFALVAGLSAAVLVMPFLLLARVAGRI